MNVWTVMSCHHYGKRNLRITSPPHFCCPRTSNSERRTRPGNQTGLKWKLLFLSYFAGISFPATTRVVVQALGNWRGGEGGKHPWQEECRTVVLQHGTGVMCLLNGWGVSPPSEVTMKTRHICIIFFLKYLNYSFFTVWDFRAYACGLSKSAYK